MPEHRTRAIVLRTFDQGESDRLVHLYTEHLGRVSALARGARRSRRRFPGLLEIFALLRVQLVESPRTSILRLDAAGLERAAEGIPSDLGRYAIACQLLEILDRFTAEHEANPELFRFAAGVLEVLDDETPDPLLALLVLSKTLARMGYRPQLVVCGECGRGLGAGAGTVAFAPRHGGAVCARCAAPEDARVQASLLAALESGLRRPLRERATLGLGPTAVRRAGQLLERFVRFHVGELRTSDFVRSTLGSGPLDADERREDTAPAPLRAGEHPRDGPTGDGTESADETSSERRPERRA